MILSKIDLLPSMDFDVSRAIANALKVNPNITTLRVSVRRGDGSEAWYRWPMGEAVVKEGDGRRENEASDA
jgi:hydrogenase nickel incorporation protein HypB